MNRLVIIGNGFDLAHGLPTKYSDFINDYWKNACDTRGTKAIINEKDEFVKIICRFGFSYNVSEYNAIDKLQSYDELKSFIGKNQNKSGDFILEFKNLFFEKISENSIKNWVDIENEYYRELKKIVKSTVLNFENKKRKTIVLNKEFKEIKSLFEKYLKEKVVEKFNFDSFGSDKFIEFFNIFYPDLLEDKFDRLKENAFSEDDKLYIDEMIKEDKHKDIKLHLLCFNYTPTLEKYVDSLRKRNVNIHLNFIHGEIDNIDDNKINFGFGDEMDEDYKLIENLDDNEYLENFKSFQYLQNSNYKKLLDFVDNDKYEVLIMGHSCGLSDRTLLNTIFENLNCSLIRVFYHKREKGTDNYTEIIQNISRHFNDKKVMRRKIANKTFCEPMPRNELPRK